jgi:hypothetical protein
MRFASLDQDGNAMPPGTDYAADFRERAEELRSIAAVVSERRNREALLRCAADYERLAERYKAGIPAKRGTRSRFAHCGCMESSGYETRAADCREMAAQARNETDAKAWRIIAERWDSLARIKNVSDALPEQNLPRPRN